MILTALFRQTLIPKSPLALIDAPQAGTGKSLLAEACHEITTGRPAAMTTAPDTSRYADEEWRKRITAILLAWASIIIIDNVEGILSSPSLAAASPRQFGPTGFLGRANKLTFRNSQAGSRRAITSAPGAIYLEDVIGFASTPKQHVPFSGQISNTPT